MKKTLYIFLSLLIFSTIFTSYMGCGSNHSKITAIEFSDVKTVADMNAYASEVVKNGVSNDDPLENGIVICPYYILDVNGTNVPVYSTRVTNGIHSFAWIDVESSNILLNITLNLNNTHKKVDVLPLSSNIKASIINNVVKAKITSLGSFSFSFDDNPNSEALTIIVAYEQKLKVPKDYVTQDIQPGEYTAQDLNFSQGQTVYRFKSGRYKITSINIPSNSIIYFERGCYIEVYQTSINDYVSAFLSRETSNIKIIGRCLVDFSACMGGDKKTKGAFDFFQVKDFEFSGIVSINSNNWTLCFTYSKNININNCMFFGYRTYSDGIMLSDCQNSIASDCFLRTGDDAAEIKSTGPSHKDDCFTDNIIYQNIAVWTDKANAFGAIYEANHKAQNIFFKNCSVGYAQPTWTERLGCLVVQMGDNKAAIWENIHFENIEIFKNECALINIYLNDRDGTEGGQAKNIFFKNITSKTCYGLPVRISISKNCRLGQVYLDNVIFGKHTITPADINNSSIISVLDANNNWSPSINIKINTQN